MDDAAPVTGRQRRRHDPANARRGTASRAPWNENKTAMPMNDRITIRIPREMMERIDAWIATQPSYVSRQEAVRQLIDEGLAARGLVGSSNRAICGEDLTDPR